MILEILTPAQRDAAAEFGMAAHAFFAVRGPVTPDPIWRRYLATKDELARVLAAPTERAA